MRLLPASLQRLWRIPHRQTFTTMAAPHPAKRMELLGAKRQLRTSIKTALKSIEPERLDEESSKICLNVLELDIFRIAQKVGIYIHCPRLREVNTSWIVAEALNQGKQCFIPKVVSSNSHMELLHIESVPDLVEVPPFGILEPTERYPNSNKPRLNALDVGLDVLLVPGLGFDRTGGRLGRGGGYYDAFIHRCEAAARSHNRAPPQLIGLAFECQLMAKAIPIDDHDRHMEYLVTAQRVYTCKDETLTTNA